jgi:hypothetical protein
MEEIMKKIITMMLIFASALVSICFLLIIVLFVMDNIPNYLAIPIEPPNINNTNGKWNNIHCKKIPSGLGGYDICIGDAELVSNNIEELINYFDNTLRLHGWERNNYYSPCNDILIEENLANDKKDSKMIYYRKMDYVVTYDYIEEELICINIVYMENNSRKSNIEIFTMRPSILMQLNDIY